jgi:hypothetical protein
VFYQWLARPPLRTKQTKEKRSLPEDLSLNEISSNEITFSVIGAIGHEYIDSHHHKGMFDAASLKFERAAGACHEEFALAPFFRASQYACLHSGTAFYKIFTSPCLSSLH